MISLSELSQDITKLWDVLDPYYKELEDYEAHLKLKGKTLERVNREQATYLAYYDERRIELHTLVRFLDDYVNKIKGKCWKSYTENMSIDLGPRDKERYVAQEPKVIQAREIFLEVNQLFEKYQMVVDAFIQRGYALRNITEIRVNSLQDITL